MTDSWTSPSVIVAGIATAVALGSLAVSLLVYRQQRRESDETPRLHFDIEGVEGEPDWFRVTAELINYSAFKWRIATAELRRPQPGGIATSKDLAPEGDEADLYFPPRLNIVFAIIDLVLAPKGITDPQKDHVRFELFVCALTEENDLEILLYLVSMDSNQRPKMLTIRGKLPFVMDREIYFP